MARKSPLLEKLAAPAAEVTDAPTTEAPAAGSPASPTTESHPPAGYRTSSSPVEPDRLAPPVIDPHQVWANLIRTPEGQRLTDSRIQSLSPQRFDFVFLDSLKSAFFAGWDARKGVEK